jgi:DNA-binding beta-propeller fold protein YncE
MPPELPRYQYEASLRSVASVMLETDADRFRRLATGASLPIDPILEKPTAVAARDGRVYVADSVKRRIMVFDNPRRKVFEFGLRSPGELLKPLGIALDAAGRVYVADATRRQIVIYDSLGLYQSAIGDKSLLEHPVAVTANADGSRIYVVDRGSNESRNHRIQMFDAGGKHIGQIGRRGAGDGEFNVPVQAAVAGNGQLYVLDAGNFRVQVFTPEGVYLRSFGSAGNGLGQFARPRGLALDSAGLVYVSDAGFANVQVFDTAGNLLLPLGERDLEGGPGRFVLPAGIAVDETRRVFIVDQYLRKVEVLRWLNEAQGRALIENRSTR